ncbi:MAG: helix-turn-helix transcriptional regulator [Sulfurimonas sp.]|jgi:predicted transcriptional regulator
MILSTYIPSDIRLQTNTQIAFLFAQRLQKERIVAELTQVELAKKAKIPYSAIVRFETTGEIQFVRLIQILKVLKKLNILEEIITYDPIKALDDFEAIEKRQHKEKARRVRKNGQ